MPINAFRVALRMGRFDVIDDFELTLLSPGDPCCCVIDAFLFLVLTESSASLQLLYSLLAFRHEARLVRGVAFVLWLRRRPVLPDLRTRPLVLVTGAITKIMRLSVFIFIFFEYICT